MHLRSQSELELRSNLLFYVSHIPDFMPTGGPINIQVKPLRSFGHSETDPKVNREAYSSMH